MNIKDKKYDLIRWDKLIYDVAMRSKERLNRNNNEDFENFIIDTMHGYDLEIWLRVFSDNSIMCDKFIHAHINHLMESEFQ